MAPCVGDEVDVGCDGRATAAAIWSTRAPLIATAGPEISPNSPLVPSSSVPIISVGDVLDPAAVAAAEEEEEEEEEEVAVAPASPLPPARGDRPRFDVLLESCGEARAEVFRAFFIAIFTSA